MSLCLGQELFPSNPFVEQTSAPDAKYYPIGLTFVELVRLYYGIHKIKIEVPLNWTIEAQSGPLSVDASIANYETDLDTIVSSWGSQVLREEDYLRETPFFGTFHLSQTGDITNSESDNGGGHYVSANGSFSVTLSMFHPGYGIIVYNGLYYPRCELYIAGSVSAYALDSAPPTDPSYRSFDFYAAIDLPMGTPAYSLNCNFFGHNIELQGYQISNSASGSGSAVTTVIGGPPADMTVSVGKWWPYDPGDGGGPIWDVDTGAKLRNKF